MSEEIFLLIINWSLSLAVISGVLLCINHGKVPKAPPSFIGWIGLLGIAIGTFGEVFEPNTGFWGFLSEPSYNPSFFYYNVFMVSRPAWIPTDSICEQAREMASRGLTVSQISDCLGISESTLYGKQNE